MVVIKEKGKHFESFGPRSPRMNKPSKYDSATDDGGARTAGIRRG